MFNTVELVKGLKWWNSHLMDYRSAIKTDVYKEF